MQLKSKNLFGAILLFILLDFSILAINYWMTYQLSKDAVAINLSGRQRMLSQQITKSLLQLQSPHSAEASRAANVEFRESVRLFDQTLLAFKQGGAAVSGNGGTVILDRVSTAEAVQLIDQTFAIWHPMREQMSPYLHTQTEIPIWVMGRARSQMLHDNLNILELMNRLTSSLERDSLNRATHLRILQTAIFILALINFLAIVRKFHLLAQQSAKTTEHYNELAMRDPLTGLFNRRQFEHNLEIAVDAVNRRERDKFALVMLDLNEFKKVNDQHGHEVGDVVLRVVATRLSEGARVNDTVARFGGDEFMLICPDLQNQENADAFCQRMLDSLKRPIPTEAGLIYIGASIGTVFYPDAADSVFELVRRADSAMYAAKKQRGDSA